MLIVLNLELKERSPLHIHHNKMVFLNTKIEHYLVLPLQCYHMLLYPKFEGGGALLITNYLQNQSPTKVVPYSITPYEIWFGHKPIISH